MNDYSRAKAFIKSSPISELAPDELAHYGVLGMQWGVRKDEDGNPTRAMQARETRRKIVNTALRTNVGIEATKKAKAAIQKRKEATKSRQSADHIESRRLAKRKREELSNNEIDRIINRLQKEKKVKDLNPQGIDRGLKIVAALVAAGTLGASAYGLVTGKAGQAAIKRGSQLVKLILSSRAGITASAAAVPGAIQIVPTALKTLL